MRDDTPPFFPQNFDAKTSRYHGPRNARNAQTPVTMITKTPDSSPRAASAAVVVLFVPVFVGAGAIGRGCSRTQCFLCCSMPETSIHAHFGGTHEHGRSSNTG